MSKKSRMRRRLELEAAARKPAAPLSGNSSTPLVERPSIAALVLQRMGKLGLGGAQTIPLVKVPAESGIQTVPPEPPKVETPKPVVKAEPQPADWPTCPATCDPTEWRRSLEARDHYLLCQMEDGGKKPWFQYTRFTYQYSEFVYLTPDMALALLQHMPINRKVKKAWIEAITRDILENRWLQTHESIAVNKDGNMHDGQHRAQGVVKANRGWPLYFTFNVPPEAIYVTDSGERRKVNEKLSLLFPDQKITNKTAALCRSMMWGLTNRNMKYSESEIAEFAVKQQKVLEWVAENLKSTSGLSFRADLQAVVAKAVLWWGEEKIHPFVERIRNLQFLGDGDPAKALYVWLQKAKQEGSRTSYTGPMIYYQKTLSAIHSWAEGREAKKIIRKEKDVFEWEPGWNVPADAPCGGKPFVDKEEPQTEE